MSPDSETRKSHELRGQIAACKHESCSFDRSVCACGSMHDYCDECGAAMDCPLDKEPQEQSASSLLERLLWWVADKAERAAFRMKEARRA